MNLHQNEGVFLEMIQATSEYTGIPQEFIEKDYYVSLLLKELVGLYPYIIIKGGTSLLILLLLIKNDISNSVCHNEYYIAFNTGVLNHIQKQSNPNTVKIF